jgi:hypothetical protein
MFTNNPFAAVTEDVLSSQANIAGYRAVLDAARLYKGASLSAGSAKPSRVVGWARASRGCRPLPRRGAWGAQVWGPTTYAPK